MVIYGNGYHLLGLILTDDIFIQLPFDNMGRRYLLYIKGRPSLLFFLFFRLRLRRSGLEIPSKNILALKHIRIVKSGTAHKVYASLQAVNADAHIRHVGNADQPPCLALGSPADIAHILMLPVLAAVVVIFISVIFHIIFTISCVIQPCRLYRYHNRYYIPNASSLQAHYRDCLPRKRGRHPDLSGWQPRKGSSPDLYLLSAVKLFKKVFRALIGSAPAAAAVSIPAAAAVRGGRISR